jgi:hypothetical protein
LTSSKPKVWRPCVSNTGGLLKREAQHIAGQMRAQISNFEAQLEELQKQMQVLETQLHMARLATKRAASYRYNVNGVRYCPNCWIKDESRSRVVSISSGSDDYDLWRCMKCKKEVYDAVD